MNNQRLAKLVKRISRWCLICLIVGLPFFFGGVAAEGILFTRIMALLVFVTWVSSMILEGKICLKKTGLEIPILLFFLLAVGLSIHSLYRYANINILIDWGICAFVFLATANLFDRHFWLRRVVKLMILTGAVLSIFGLLQYAGVLGNSWWSSLAVSSTYVNKNHFAGLLIMMIPLTLGFCVNIRDFGKRLLLNYLVMLMGITLFLTFSKAGWGSLLITFVFMVFCLKYKSNGYRLKNFAIIAGITLFLILSVLFWQSAADHLMGEAWQEANNGWAGLNIRLALWEIASRLLIKNPVFGYGPGSFALVTPKFRPAGLDYLLDYAHNDFLHLGVETGVAGLLIVSWGVVTFFRRCLINLSRYTYSWGLRWGAMAGVLALMIHGLVEFQFSIPANAVLCFSLAGLAVSGWRNHET